MSDTAANLRRKIGRAVELQSVVRTMKAVAASSIGQYESTVRALTDYYRTVELGLSVYFREFKPATLINGLKKQSATRVIRAVVFGSDQGLVGQFNDVLADYAINTITSITSSKPEVWAIGERVHSRLVDAGVTPIELFSVPNSVETITPLVGQILLAYEERDRQNEDAELHLVYNHLTSAAGYEPTTHRLLPLDATWQRQLIELPWPTKNLPEVIGGGISILRAFVREYIFVALFRSCAESLASENASRLAAMQRADKNINDLLENLNRTFHRLRQSHIDEELFDLVTGYEALSHDRH